MKALLASLALVTGAASAANPADCYTITYSEAPTTKIIVPKKRVHKHVHKHVVGPKKHVVRKRKPAVVVVPDRILRPHKTWYECPPPPASVPVPPGLLPPVLIPPGLWYYPGPNVYIPPSYPLVPPEPYYPIYPAPPYYWFPYVPYYPPGYVPPVLPPAPPAPPTDDTPFPVPPGYWPPNMPPPTDIQPPKPPDNPYYPPVYVPPITTPPSDTIPPGGPTFPPKDTPPTDVPEPGTVALFGIALAALAITRKRKK